MFRNFRDREFRHTFPAGAAGTDSAPGVADGVGPGRGARGLTMGWISRADVERWFTYKAPDAGQVEAIRRIRAKAHELAELILEATPGCADQSTAVRKIREAVMTANAAIVCARQPLSGPGSGVVTLTLDPGDPSARSEWQCPGCDAKCCEINPARYMGPARVTCPKCGADFGTTFGEEGLPVRGRAGAR